ncbi:hypothetical protein D9619_008544 [Psilocybe cf. subviscida]|uniref:Uncharacterized protein n=1 Tax=Psilocybe cf. subviscida TaxID=2480587 RepID=A0A8H5BAW2_9AGAR|nr:hypothetical protein D9619_008544 [Psilocybe cf. subviscida]
MAKDLDTVQKDPLMSVDAASPEKVVDDPQPASNLVIEDLQIGVRKFRVARPRAKIFSGLFNARAYAASHLPILVRLATDIVKISPHYTLVFLLSNCGPQ